MRAILTATAPFVLIDAPCTATGTIRRHPDLPWIKGAADVTVSAARGLRDSGKRRARWSSPAARWSLPSARWSARKAKSRSPPSWPRIRNSRARRSRRTKCSVTANGSRRTATCAPCPVTLSAIEGRHGSGFLSRRGCEAEASEPPQRISDRQIDLAGIRRQQVEVSSPPPSPSRARVSRVSNSRQIGIGRVMEALVVAIQRGDAVHRLLVDGVGQPAREHGAVAGQIALPVLVARLRQSSSADRSIAMSASASSSAPKVAAVSSPTLRTRAGGCRSLSPPPPAGSSFPSSWPPGACRSSDGLRVVSLRARPFRPSPSGSACGFIGPPGIGRRQLAGGAGMQGGHGARRQDPESVRSRPPPSGAPGALLPAPGRAGGSDAFPRRAVVSASRLRILLASALISPAARSSRSHSAIASPTSRRASCLAWAALSPIRVWAPAPASFSAADKVGQHARWPLRWLPSAARPRARRRRSAARRGWRHWP